MQLSARNQIKGTVAGIEVGAVMAKVKVDIGGGNSIAALISKEAAEDLQLKAGDSVVAIVKATEVMIGK